MAVWSLDMPPEAGARMSTGRLGSSVVLKQTLISVSPAHDFPRIDGLSASPDCCAFLILDSRLATGIPGICIIILTHPVYLLPLGLRLLTFTIHCAHDHP